MLEDEENSLLEDQKDFRKIRLSLENMLMGMETRRILTCNR